MGADGLALVVAVGGSGRGQATRPPPARDVLRPVNGIDPRLTGNFGVFRRPQRPGDVPGRALGLGLQNEPGRVEGGVNRKLARRVAVTPRGERVYAIPGDGTVCLTGAGCTDIGSAVRGKGPVGIAQCGAATGPNQVHIRAFLPDHSQAVRVRLRDGREVPVTVRDNALVVTLPTAPEAVTPTTIVWDGPRGHDATTLGGVAAGVRCVAPPPSAADTDGGLGEREAAGGQCLGMSLGSAAPLLRWNVVVPVLAAVLLAATWGSKPAAAVLVVVGAFLGGAVLAAVHHAEVVAHRVGEPFGSLVLAVAVTVIEVALIVTLMVSGGSETSTLARDTVFAAVMITCNGIVGLSLMIGALRERFASFNAEGTATALATVSTLATLCLVLPTFTTSGPGAEFSSAQLAFAAVASVALYGLFVVIQTVRHRDYFLPVGDADPAEHAPPPSQREMLQSLALLALALVAVVGLAKIESPAIEDAVAAIGAPPSAVGVVIALLVLLPETLAAVRNARRGRVQTSFNLALGSAMASIGLTIPAIAIASIWLDGPLVLGLGATQMVLLAITVVVGALTVLPGRATVQEGGVHLVLFGAFLFLAVNP
jgi:Ca2+:H+ antiporter